MKTQLAMAATLTAMAITGATSTSAPAGDFFNGFETDATGWAVFGGAFDATRVPSGGGELGVTSATGSFHAEAVGGGQVAGQAAGNWGGYGDIGGCAATACAASAFPANGYDTSVDVYLDVDAGHADDSRFDFSSAVNRPDGSHRRDFIFSCGFYDEATGAGTDGFVCSASNNTPGWPKDPHRQPTVIATTSGWYTFRHQFRDNGSGVLTVDLSILNAGGTVIKTWTLSDPTDVIGTTVGGNRYGWFIPNSAGTGGSIGTLAFDNTRRTNIVPNGPSLACVGFDVAKFEPPLDTDVSVKKANRVLPLRMALLDADEVSLTDLDLAAAPVLEVTYTGAATTNPDLTQLDTAGKGDDGNMFVFNGSNWSFNMKTKGLAPGSYMLTTVSGDNAEYVIDPACNVTLTVQ